METRAGPGTGKRRQHLLTEHNQLVLCCCEPTHGRGLSSCLRAVLNSQLALLAVAFLLADNIKSATEVEAAGGDSALLRSMQCMPIETNLF